MVSFVDGPMKLSAVQRFCLFEQVCNSHLVQKVGGWWTVNRKDGYLAITGSLNNLFITRIGDQRVNTVLFKEADNCSSFFYGNGKREKSYQYPYSGLRESIYR